MTLNLEQMIGKSLNKMTSNFGHLSIREGVRTLSLTLDGRCRISSTGCRPGDSQSTSPDQLTNSTFCGVV
jgi:hypothetical protein